MTPTESATLARYIGAHFPHQPVDEFTGDALGELLERYPFADCREAVLAIAMRGEKWCAPTEVLAEVKRTRSKRIAEHPPLLPPPGLDDAEERRWIREARWRIGNGEVIDCDAAYGELVSGPEINLRELLPATTDDTQEEA